VGEMVEFPSNGQKASGYLATPSSGAGPGVVVIQEYWGLMPEIKAYCDQLAGEGFTALAVDLYHGETTREPDEAGKKMMALQLDRARKEMSGAVSWLLQGDRARGDGVGVVGFCMGGGLAYLLATDRPEVRACVAYYGVIAWPGVKADFGRSRAAFLAHYGDKDAFCSREMVDALEQQIASAGRRVEFHHYPGLDHAFANEVRPEVYNAEAAQLAWDRTRAFLRQHLAE